ncbi:hypothetical protein GCM10029978_095000 [Actinoallomurus acanthiterrae]
MSEPQSDVAMSLTRTVAGVLVAIGVVVLAVWLEFFPINGFRYAAGLAGTPGTFTAAHCHTYGSGRGSRRVCTGTFTPANGGPADPAARITNARVHVGKPTTLRRKADGGYAKPGAADAVLDVAGVLGIVSLAALALLVLCVMPRRVRVEADVPLSSNPRPWGTLIPVLLWSFAGFLAAAALCGVAAVLLALGQAFFG